MVAVGPLKILKWMIYLPFRTCKSQLDRFNGSTQQKKQIKEMTIAELVHIFNIYNTLWILLFPHFCLLFFTLIFYK